jgi:hypothetical protein
LWGRYRAPHRPTGSCYTRARRAPVHFRFFHGSYSSSVPYGESRSIEGPQRRRSWRVAVGNLQGEGEIWQRSLAGAPVGISGLSLGVLTHRLAILPVLTSSQKMVNCCAVPILLRRSSPSTGTCRYSMMAAWYGLRVSGTETQRSKVSRRSICLKLAKPMPVRTFVH